MPTTLPDIVVFSPGPLSSDAFALNNRAVHLAQALDFAGHSVTLALPNPEILPPTHFRVTSSDPETLDSLVRRHSVSISTGQEYNPRAVSAEHQIQIFDVSDLSFEQLRRPDHAVRDRVATIFESADLILCGSIYQRDFWMGLATGHGFFNEERQLNRNPLDWFAVVPYGHPGTSIPQWVDLPHWLDALPAEARLFTWNAGYDKPVDANTFLAAAELHLAGSPGDHVLFLPTHVPTAEWEALRSRAAEMDLHHLHVPEQVETVAREQILLRSTAVVCSMLDCMDSHLWPAPPLLEAIWRNVPVISSRGSYMAFLAEELNIGYGHAPGDAPDLAAKMLRISDGAEQERIRARLKEASPLLSWEVAVRPLVEFLRNPPGPFHAQAEEPSLWGKSVWRAVGRLFE